MITITSAEDNVTTINAPLEKVSISPQIAYGGTLFKKKLRRLCGYSPGPSGGIQTHSKEKWKRLKEKGFFRIELYKICPKSVSVLKDKWIEPLYAFAYTYASDSGNFAD